MKNLTKKITAFLTDEQGAETVEWVIVVAIVAGIAVAGYQTTLGGAITGAIGTVTTNLTAAGS